MGKTLLLVCDFQNGIMHGVENADEVTAAANRAVEHAQAKGFLVAYVRVAFQPGHPEIADSNRLFCGIKAGGVLVLGTPTADFRSDLKVIENAPVFTKCRVSPFTSTGLDHFMHASQVTDVAVCGVSTSLVVFSTVRHCFDRDLSVTVLSDACGDHHPAAQEALLKEVFPNEADVMKVAEWAQK